MIIALYLLSLAALLVYAPDALWDPGAREFFVLIGLIGAWRYGWGFLHFLRSWYYRNVTFARLRTQLTQAENAAVKDAGGEPNPELIGPSELFVVVTSFRIQAETTAAAYRSIITDAIRCQRKVTILASIVENGDQRFIKSIFKQCQPPARVKLAFVRLSGLGKRQALAVALNAIIRHRPAADAAVAVMDGDTILAPDSFARTLPFFALQPEMGGLTTDEDSVTAGSKLMGHWHRLRFAQRQILMSSMALSGKVLAMTGRFSIFRASIATHPDFIRAVREDSIDHWRLGELKLLTGEDKSTWYWLLKNGWNMLYVPDVRVWTVEHPPANDFLSASSLLMTRWFGNMIRASGRAIALGPQRCGWFTWWCLIDQRVSMWTPLIGPTAVLMAAIFFSPWILYAYLIWIMFTRLMQTLLLLSVRNTISGLYPFLIYFSQVYGALIKTFVLFRPNRQRWTRQNIVGPASQTSQNSAVQSALLHGLAMAYLFVGVGFLLGVLQWPSALSLSRLF